MKKRRPNVTIRDHVALGNALKSARDAAQRVRLEFSKSSYPSRAAKRVESALISLQSALDDEVCALVPVSRDPRRLATAIYYGTPVVDTDGERDPDDAFAGWTTSDREQVKS